MIEDKCLLDVICSVRLPDCSCPRIFTMPITEERMSDSFHVITGEHVSNANNYTNERLKQG
jgi:hypothetical protein